MVLVRLICPVRDAAPAAPAAHRRALWRFVVRSVPDPWLATFDCPDPSQSAPRRLVTTTPLQALALFNSPFALHAAERMAARCAAETASLEAQVTRAWTLACGQPPTEREREALVEHARERGLAATCRVILNSAAFLHVE